MNAKEMLDIANKYMQIADDITKRIFEDDWYYHYPQIVIISFACEVFLKALLLNRGIVYSVKKQGHEIKSLFYLQNQDIQQKISLLLSKKIEIETLPIRLDEINTAFLDWRYAFEHTKPLNLDVLFLYDFAFAINTVAEEEIK